MSANSHIAITGNLTDAPEVKVTAKGATLISASVAVQDTDYTGKSVEGSTSYFKFSAWNRLAENAATLPKGARVTVTGKLVQRKWKTPEGENRSSIEIQADTIAAELTFATVEVTRNERNNGSTYQSAAPATVSPAVADEVFLNAEEPF